MTNWPGHAVLQIGVPELEDWIVARTRHYDDSFISTDPDFRHAHITILAPLDHWDDQAIAEIAANTPAFDYRLDRVAAFPNGCLHLPPAPDAPFRELTRRAWAAHPAIVPNGAPDPQPHLTVDWLSEQVSIASTQELLGPAVPVDCIAEALELVWYESNNCHLIKRFDLK